GASPKRAKARASAFRIKPRRKGDRLMEFLESEVFVFINNLSFPRLVNCATAALNEERSCREKRSFQHSNLGLQKSCKNIADSSRQEYQIIRRSNEIASEPQHPLSPLCEMRIRTVREMDCLFANLSLTADDVLISR